MKQEIVNGEGQKHTIRETSVDTMLVHDLLEKKEVGDVVTYAELTKLIGRDIQNKARGCLNTAKRMLQREKRFVFGTIMTVGVKRLDDVQIVGTSESTLKKIRGESKRGARRLACVHDYDGLPNGEKIKHNAAVSMLGALSQATKPGSIKRIESKVAEANERLAIGSTLEAFKD